MRVSQKSISFRFYAELNDFLPESKRQKSFEHIYIDDAAVKDMIESLGIPHTEIDLITANGSPVSFDYIPSDKDLVNVYPAFMEIIIPDEMNLKQKPEGKPAFIADVHLGKLARYLRMLGFDTVFAGDKPDEEIARISETEKRVLLTGDSGLLKRGNVEMGRYIRNTEPVLQIEEVMKCYELKEYIDEFSRCMVCNSGLEKIAKSEVIDQVPAGSAEHYVDFRKCTGCGKVYWKGSHYENMLKAIEKFIQ